MCVGSMKPDAPPPPPPPTRIEAPPPVVMAPEEESGDVELMKDGKSRKKKKSGLNQLRIDMSLGAPKGSGSGSGLNIPT